MISSIFMQELQKGFYIPSIEGKTLYSFLTENCGFSDEYISEKIKTILIDGGPVDDIFNTKIHDGVICALSGAMPGIVGAMMRMGSPYAAMRESITVKPGKSNDPAKEIKIGLKIFNIILSDRGNDFLKNGIMIEKERISDLFKKHSDEIFLNRGEVIINGISSGKQKLKGNVLEFINEFVILKVEMDREN